MPCINSSVKITGFKFRVLAGIMNWTGPGFLISLGLVLKTITCPNSYYIAKNLIILIRLIYAEKTISLSKK